MVKIDPATVNSLIGEITLDNLGAALGVSRIEADKSYQGISELLKKVIETADQDAWNQIKGKINYTYDNLDKALTALEKEEGFVTRIKKQVAMGKKLLFKPNLVTVENIEPYTHRQLTGTCANTEWSFVAAVMRWFHDKANIRYAQMCLGEAASNSVLKAAQYSRIKFSGRPVTPEAAYEGRSDDFYGGWGFYFARVYLAEESNRTSSDDPMKGLEESMSGTFIPPGNSDDRLMVYDLNRINDDPAKGREIPLPDGENFKSIILHKVIMGGDSSDPDDCLLYPGSVLINLPKLKVHSQAMFTNAIKNLGIGLYPLQANRSQCKRWEYAFPDSNIPAIKSKIPHQVWVPELDPETLAPQKDDKGKYLVTRTGGLTGTMLDIIRAVEAQDIFMMHIVDAIEAVNRDHQGTGLGVVIPEGLIVAGTDVVATDLMCARYMFSNVGLKEAHATGLEDGFGGFFPQAVPLPRLDRQIIHTDRSYDCPIARDASIARAQKYGLGETSYYINGWDAVSGNPLASSGGRLGFIADGLFSDIHTTALYWDIYKMPWDLQKTFLGYLEAVDQLENNTLKSEFLNAFDESGDGTVTYEENGRKGIYGPALFLGGLYQSLKVMKDGGEMFRSYYALMATPLQGVNRDWNADQHDFNREFSWGAVTVVAQMMSTLEADVPDRHFPELTWGKGRWPSFSQAKDTYLHQILYGWKFPKHIGIFSLYGSVFAYADHYLNNSTFIGSVYSAPNPKAPQLYLDAVKNNKMEPLDFTFFVPCGYGASGRLPNVKETSDPARILTAEFDRGNVRWPDATVNGMRH